MAKRKRIENSIKDDAENSPVTKKARNPVEDSPYSPRDDERIAIQIISGSYDRVLHGIAVAVQPAVLPSEDAGQKEVPRTSPTVQFTDTFLFDAHTSAIRCLAISPPSAPVPGQAQKVILASGSSDERINLYHLSAHPPSARSAAEQQALGAAAPRPILENPKNRELGALLHHGGAVTRLAFPNRAKLLSASEDSTVAVTRTRDWAALHSFRCPVPRPQGRPAGDTATAGTAPRGVNDFAVHPSMKIMLTVGRAERRLRLWNLVTGKKARKLMFPSAALAEIGEGGRHTTGEGRRVVWGRNDGEDEFAVGFDRDALVFGMDCQVRCRVMPDARTKIHELHYVKTGEEADKSVLAISTEDGRVLFFSTRTEDVQARRPEGLPSARWVAQLGGKPAGVSGRIKDFKMLPVRTEDGRRSWYVVTGSSDGRLRLWKLEPGDLAAADGEAAGRQVGQLLGTYETQNRITCVEAFVMIPRPEGADESEFEFDDSEVEDEDSDEDGVASVQTNSKP